MFIDLILCCAIYRSAMVPSDCCSLLLSWPTPELIRSVVSSSLRV